MAKKTSTQTIVPPAKQILARLKTIKYNSLILDLHMQLLSLLILDLYARPSCNQMLRVSGAKWSNL